MSSAKRKQGESAAKFVLRQAADADASRRVHQMHLTQSGNRASFAYHNKRGKR